MGSERFSFNRAEFFASQPPESHQEITITLTIFVSDRQSFWTVDVWEGAPSATVSLHKYLYVNASPVSSIDPSGHISMPELMVRTGVDKIIERSALVNRVVQGVKTINNLCKGVDFAAKVYTSLTIASDVIEGIYVIINPTTGASYIGESIDVASRIVQHQSAPGKAALFAGGQETIMVIEARGAKSTGGLAKAMLRNFEQLFMDELLADGAAAVSGPGGAIGAAGNLNAIRGRALGKYLKFLERFCPK